MGLRHRHQVVFRQTGGGPFRQNLGRVVRPHAIRALFRTCDRLGRPLYQLFGLGAGIWEYQSVLGGEESQYREACWASAALTVKNWNIRRLLRVYGIDCFDGIVQWETPPGQLVAWQAAGVPVLLLGWHSGIPFSLIHALKQAELSCLFCVGGEAFFPLPDNIEYATTEGGAEARSEALHRCLTRLRKGGMVYLLADHPHFGENTARMWGRRVNLAPSLQMLVRLTQARVVPLTTHWYSEGRIGVRHHPPLEVCQTDQALRHKVGQWFEQHLTRHPEELERGALLKLLYSPPWQA